MITIDHLSKKYTNATVLSDICFNIPQGSIFGLLGPNGAGKTTLIRILTGIITPDLGQVLINGRPQSKLSLKKIGYLPEERGLYKKMKVGEQSIYLTVMKGLPKQEAEKRLTQWFQRLEICDWWNKKVETLSKGMQQKIQFIISVVHQPDVLILDEPFSGLDPINRDVIGNEILELNRTGMTIIISTHDMNSVEQFCNQVVLIDEGRILLAGKVNEIKQSNKSFLYELCLEGDEEIFLNQCNMLGIKIVSQNKNNTIFCAKVQFHNELEIEVLLTWILGRLRLVSFKEILPSMQEIFIESVKKSKL